MRRFQTRLIGEGTIIWSLIQVYDQLANSVFLRSLSEPIKYHMNNARDYFRSIPPKANSYCGFLLCYRATVLSNNVDQGVQATTEVDQMLLERLKLQVEAFTSENEALQLQLSEERKQKMAGDAQAKLVAIKLAQTQVTVRELKEQVRDLEETYQRTSETCKELQLEVDNFDLKLRKTLENYRLVMRRIESMAGRTRSLEQDNESLSEELMKLYDNMKMFQQKVLEQKDPQAAKGYRQPIISTPPSTVTKRSPMVMGTPMQHMEPSQIQQQIVEVIKEKIVYIPINIDSSTNHAEHAAKTEDVLKDFERKLNLAETTVRIANQRISEIEKHNIQLTRQLAKAQQQQNQPQQPTQTTQPDVNLTFKAKQQVVKESKKQILFSFITFELMVQKDAYTSEQDQIPPQFTNQDIVKHLSGINTPIEEQRPIIRIQEVGPQPIIMVGDRVVTLNLAPIQYHHHQQINYFKSEKPQPTCENFTQQFPENQENKRIENSKNSVSLMVQTEDLVEEELLKQLREQKLITGLYPVKGLLLKSYNSSKDEPYQTNYQHKRFPLQKGLLLPIKKKNQQ